MYKTLRADELKHNMIVLLPYGTGRVIMSEPMSYGRREVKILGLDIQDGLHVIVSASFPFRIDAGEEQR